MVSILSPGVYLIEKDISNYPPSIGATTVGVVGFATKGPTDKATLVTSQDNLVDTFGYPTETLPGQGLIGALEILETTNSMYFVRVASDDAKNASATIPLGGCPAFAVSSIGLGITSGAVFKVQVTNNAGENGFSEIKSYSVPVSGYRTQQEALAAVFGTDIDTLKVTAQFPFTYDADGNVLPSNVDSVSAYYETSSTNTAAVSSAGFIVGSFAGPNATLSVTAYEPGGETPLSGVLFPITAPNGDFGYAASGGGNITSSGINYIGGSVSGFKIKESAFNFRIESLYPGTGYNLGFNDDNTVRGNSIEVKSFGGPNFLINVNESGGAYENFRANLKKGDFFLPTVIGATVDNATSEVITGALYVSGSLLSSPSGVTHFSDPVSAITQESEIEAAYGSETVGTVVAGIRFVKPLDATYALSGGNNGSPSSYVATVIGDSADKTGLYALDDDLLNLTIAVIPGLHDQAIQNALITLAETTTNFMAVVSPPQGKLNVQQAIDWSNGFADDRTAPINSSYAAIYWPYVQTYVPAYARDAWLDPAIYGARQIVYTAATSELWFAPAGFIRGRLTKPTDVEVNLGQGDRDAMYSGGNAINPIVNFPQRGITIFGQRTSQRAPTALDRVNVRLLSIYLKKALLASVQDFLFEPNDPILWERVGDAANAVLAPIKSSRGIVEYRVKCDETTNTPARVDRNELWCKVIVKPTKTAEAIVFELNLTSQSAVIN